MCFCTFVQNDTSIWTTTLIPCVQSVSALMTFSAVGLISVLQNFPKQAKDKIEEEKKVKKDKRGNKRQQQKGIDYQCFPGPVFFIKEYTFALLFSHICTLEALKLAKKVKLSSFLNLTSEACTLITELNGKRERERH